MSRSLKQSSTSWSPSRRKSGHVCSPCCQTSRKAMEAEVGRSHSNNYVLRSQVSCRLEWNDGAARRMDLYHNPVLRDAWARAPIRA